MTLYFLFPLHFVFPEIKFQSLGTGYLSPEKARLDVKIWVKLLLHPYLCQPNLQLQCHLFIFIALFFDNLWKFAKILVLWSFLKILFHLPKLFCRPEKYGFTIGISFFNFSVDEFLIGNC